MLSLAVFENRAVEVVDEVRDVLHSHNTKNLTPVFNEFPALDISDKGAAVEPSPKIGTVPVGGLSSLGGVRSLDIA